MSFGRVVRFRDASVSRGFELPSSQCTETLRGLCCAAGCIEPNLTPSEPVIYDAVTQGSSTIRARIDCAACQCIQGANALATPHCWTSGRLTCTTHRARGRTCCRRRDDCKHPKVARRLEDERRKAWVRLRGRRVDAVRQGRHGGRAGQVRASAQISRRLLDSVATQWFFAHRSAPSTFGAPRPKSKREIRKEALAEAAASGLPEGWVEVTDDSGRVAFYGNVGNCVETKHRASPSMRRSSGGNVASMAWGV